jgi:GT2 family glycosyltransferase/glycosyltransferase involved in cell wall biosynthesis
MYGCADTHKVGIFMAESTVIKGTEIISDSSRFRGEDVDIQQRARRIGFTKSLALEWKKDATSEGGSGYETGTQEIDNISVLRIKTPASDGWTRLHKTVPTRKVDSLLGVRMIVKVVSERLAAMPAIRPAIAISNLATGRREAISGCFTDLKLRQDTWHEIHGVYACAAASGDQSIDLMVNIPDDSVVQIAAIDIEWHNALFSQAIERDLKKSSALPLKSFQIQRSSTDEIPPELGADPVLIHDVKVSGLDVTGWVLASGNPKRITLSANGCSTTTALSSLVEIAPGISVKCGFSESITSLIGGSDEDIKCVFEHDLENPFATVDIPKALKRLQIQGTDDADSSSDAEETSLFYFPDYTATNPYQALMYRSMPKTTCQPGTIDDAIEKLELGGSADRVVMHLHWLNPILGGAQSVIQADNKLLEFREKLEYFVHLGGVVLWTIHNVVSHDARFAETEQKLGQAVADLATKIHIHSRALLPELTRCYKNLETKLLVQQHPNYVNYYPDFVSQEAARTRLNIPSSAKVFLFFGQLRPYKGIERLIEDFSKLQKSDPDLHLLIVGSPVHPYSKGMLKRKFEGYPNLRIIEGHVSDETIQWYYKASNWVVLPYKNILTSGSLLCSMSFSRPTIAPAMGMITDILKDGSNGFVYQPDDPDGLYKCMKAAISVEPERVEDMSKNALDSVSRLTWKRMGQALERAIRASYQFDVVTLEFEDKSRDCLLIGPKFPPKKVARTAIIVLNYENDDDVLRLIESLNRSDDNNFDLYIVDNDSPNLSEYDLAAKFPGTRVLRLTSNLGYAAGNNAAMRLIKDLPYEYVWILNPDMEVTSDALRLHIETAEARSEDAIYGAVLCRGDDKSRVASGGGYISFTGGMSTGHMFAGEQQQVLPKDPYNVDFVTGASVFLRADLLQKIGYIPEDYFLYFEETHWLLKARENGVACVVIPNIRLVHYKRSENGGVPTKYYFYYYIRNYLLFAKRIGKIDPAASARLLKSGFIRIWLDKIGVRRKAMLEIYRRLADQALSDGMTAASGRTNLLDLEMSVQEYEDVPHKAITGSTAQIDDDGVVSGLISFARKVKAECTISVISHGNIIATGVCQTVQGLAKQAGTQKMFSLKLPDSLRTGKHANFEFYLNGVLLPDLKVVKRLARLAPEYKGRIDGLRQYCCLGWVWNCNDATDKVAVEILHENKVIGSGIASEFRKDLANNKIGNGNAAFRIRLPKRFSSGEKHSLRLRVSGESEILFERGLVDADIRGGATPKPLAEALTEFYYRRQIWLAKYGFNELPIGRYVESVKRQLIAKHESQPKNQLVSVIMPAFNRAKTVVTAIKSIIAQTHENWELILIDDGSSDDTVEVVKQYISDVSEKRIKIIALPHNVGVSAARNAGLEAAKGEVIAYLDSDNIWDDHYLSVMLGEILEHDDETTAAYCGQKIIHMVSDGENQEEEMIAVRMGEFHLPLIENRNFIDLNCYVHKRSVYERLGGFNTAMRRLVDWELILRYSREHAPHYIPTLLSNYYFDNADNQITKIENYQKSFNQLKAAADQHIIGSSIDSQIDTQPVDIILMVSGVLNSDSLNQRVDALLANTQLGSNDRLTVYGHHEIEKTILARSADNIDFRTLTSPRGEGETFDPPFGTYFLDILDKRRTGADVVVLHSNALPTRNWLSKFRAAAHNVPAGGAFISRHTVKGSDVRAAQHMPFASREQDICIAVSAREQNMIDPNLGSTDALGEVSEIGAFCTYLVERNLGSLTDLDCADMSIDETYSQLSAVLRHGMQQKLVYCGQIQVYDFPVAP